MLRVRFARIGFGVDGNSSHLSHQPLNALAVHPIPLSFEKDAHLPAPVKGGFQILLVDSPHHHQVFL